MTKIIGKCPKCRKMSHETKRDAKAHAKRKYASDHLRVYKCPHKGGIGYHLGHLPRGIIAGYYSRSALRGSDG